MRSSTILINLFLLFVVSHSDLITDHKFKKCVLTETDLVYLFENTTYLYHVANLSIILGSYENIMKSKYVAEENKEEIILIEALKIQLIPFNRRLKRSLNFLGSILKFVTGSPDHDDLIEIKTGLN